MLPEDTRPRDAPGVRSGGPTAYASPMTNHPLPPGFRWPDGIRAAAMFTFDLDAELSVARQVTGRDDPASHLETAT